MADVIEANFINRKGHPLPETFALEQVPARELPRRLALPRLSEPDFPFDWHFPIKLNQPKFLTDEFELSAVEYSIAHQKITKAFYKQV